MAKKLNQQDLLKLSSIDTPPTDSVAFAAKSDGLYQKVGTTESKLSTTAELLARVKTAVPSGAKFTDTVYSHPSTHPYSMLTGVPETFAPTAHTHPATEITDTLTKVMMTVTERNKLGTLSNYTLTKEKIEALLKGDITTHTHSQYLTSYTDTKYTAGIGLTLSGTQFSLPVTISGTGTYVKSVTHNTNENGITVTLGTPPNTNTTYGLMTSTELTTGTATTSRVVSAKLLSDWINSKGYITSYINTTYTAGTNVQISAANVISATDTKYSLPTASGTTLGGVKIGSNISISSGVISVAAPYSHPSTHPASMITGLHASATTGVAGSVAWGNVTGKPGTFAPSTHTHSNISITAGTGLSGGGALSTSRTLSIASTYAPNTSTSLGASKNLNNYRTAGFYHQTSNANATTALNYPVASAGALLVETAAGVIQTYKVYNSSDVYVRGYYDTTWTAWRKLVNASDSIPWANVSSKPSTATRWPAWGEVTGKPSTFTPSSHTHSNITITAGNGLTGGGTLASNRTLTLATPSAITLSSTNSVGTSNHTHAFTPGGTTSQYIRGDGSLATYSDTTYIVATTEVNGLMSSGDKTKLDGIATGANKTTLSSSTSSTSTANAATSSAVKSAYDRGSLGVTNAATAQTRADSAYTLANGKETKFTKNDAFNKNFGTASGTVAQGNDSRINNGQTAYGWGNHASAGYIKSYVDTKYTALSGGGLTLSTGNAFSVKYGTTLGTACEGNDSRLSNARPPTTHTHAWSQITSRPTKLSEFTFDLTSWSGNLTITGTLTANALFKSSDVRLKELIQPINTSNIDNIDLIEFNWKDSGKKDYGVKAQDVEAYYPELVNTDKDGMKSVNYESLYAIKIAKLEERIKELEDKLCQKN